EVLAWSLNQIPETSSVIEHRHATTSGPTKHGLVDRGGGSYPELAKIAAESPIVALAPVRARDEAVGLLVVDAPSHSELTKENLYVVDLFAKLLALLVADDEFPGAESR
ncbi:MAG TPA: hypothetical protein VF657_14380, partial [Actinoplanes sp.]